MKKIVLSIPAAVLSCAAFGQEEAAVPAEEITLPVVKGETNASVKFLTLPFCRRLTGKAEVCKNGGNEWVPVEEGDFYPLGSAYRASAGSRLEIAFSGNSSVVIEGAGSFRTQIEKLDSKTRAIILENGTFTLNLAENLPEGAFVATAVGFSIKNPAGQSKVTITGDTGDGEKATVRCVTGSLAIDGRHFAIPTMHAANEIEIRTTHDHLETFLYGISGDFIVNLDQGVKSETEINDDGTSKEVVREDSFVWHLSPRTKVFISRAVPSIGARMSVHTMAFDAAGELRSERAFCEGRIELNSGEIVRQNKLDAEELAKKAAEATETTAATDADSTLSEENTEKKEEE